MSNQTTKNVHLEFIGGDADGRVVDSQSGSESERRLAEEVLFITNNGEVGRAMVGISLTQFEKMLNREPFVRDMAPGVCHEYQVIERVEEDKEVLIRLKYKIRKTPQTS